MMPTMNRKDVARRDIELSNAVDYSAMADLFAQDAEWVFRVFQTHLAMREQRHACAVGRVGREGLPAATIRACRRFTTGLEAKPRLRR